LRSFGDARALFDTRSGWTEDDYRLCRRIAQDTMPPDNLRLLTALYRGSAEAARQPISWADLYQKSKVDKDTLRRQLHQWVILGLIEFSDTDRFLIPQPIADDLEFTTFLGGL
jgi:predicted transcriptional regulator